MLQSTGPINFVPLIKLMLPLVITVKSVTNLLVPNVMVWN